EGRGAPRRLRQAHRTVLAARQQDRRVPRCRDLTPLVLARQVQLDRGAVSVDEGLADDAPSHPMRVADVVEAAELAIELPQPGVVAHPVRAEMDEPRLAHTSVVVDRRVPGSTGPLGVPVDSLLDVGDVEVVGTEEARYAPALLVPEPQRLHAVEPHAHADVPAHHVGDAQRALDQWADLVALVDVLPPARLRASPASRL